MFDVNWSSRGMGVILSQKEGRIDKAMAYASKGLSLIQCKFHPMEGACLLQYGELCTYNNIYTTTILH